MVNKKEEGINVMREVEIFPLMEELCK